MFKSDKRRKFILLFLLFLFTKEHLYSLDPFNLKRFEHHAFIKESMKDDSSRLCFNINSFRSVKDSTVKIQFKTSGMIFNGKPDFRSGITLDGKFGNLAYKIEPILVTAENGEDIIGSKYKRSDLSFRLVNAFIIYEFPLLKIELGRSPIFWGQSISSSIIQSGLYPAYEHLKIKFELELLS